MTRCFSSVLSAKSFSVPSSLLQYGFISMPHVALFALKKKKIIFWTNQLAMELKCTLCVNVKSPKTVCTKGPAEKSLQSMVHWVG